MSDNKSSAARQTIIQPIQAPPAPRPSQAARDAARTRTPAAASTPATQNAQRQNEPDRTLGVSPT